MYLSDDFFSRWEHIISDVDKTEVPIECIKKIVLKLTDRRRRTINIQSLRSQGLRAEEIESVINRLIGEHDGEVVDVNFTVDIEAVATIVQPETDRLLKSL